MVRRMSNFTCRASTDWWSCSRDGTREIVKGNPSAIDPQIPGRAAAPHDPRLRQRRALPEFESGLCRPPPSTGLRLVRLLDGSSAVTEWQDIGKLERRLDRLEYYTSLNVLEKDARNLFIPRADGTGLDRLQERDFRRPVLQSFSRRHGRSQSYSPPPWTSSVVRCVRSSSMNDVDTVLNTTSQRSPRPTRSPER